MEPIRRDYGGPSYALPYSTERPKRSGSGSSGRSEPRSTLSADSERRTGSSARSASNTVNHMESSVTRLLVATKMLLESLTHWSLGAQTESQVSEIYVRLGNDFYAALAAFAGYGIDMSDMFSVPSDLRSCLETCLSEPASPATLEQHLPRIREIIIRLLQGLKAKQASYKQLLLEQRTQSTAGPRAPAPPPPPAPRAAPPSEPSETASPRMGPRPIAASLPFLGKRAAPSSAPQIHQEHAPLPDDAAPLPPRVAPDEPSPPAADASSGEANLTTLRNRDALERRASKRFSAYNFNKMGVSSGLLSGAGTQLASSPHASMESRASSFVRHTPHGSLQPVEGEEEESALAIPVVGVPEVPREPPKLPERLAPIEGSPRELSAPEAPPPPPAPVPPSDEPSGPAPASEPAYVPTVAPMPAAASASVPTPLPAPEQAPAPEPSKLDLFLQLGRQTRKVTVAVDPTEPMRGLTVARLRMLFVDQFAYSPGMDDFPEIYIKDPQSGVLYQLENLEDVQSHSLLTLNIEPLDQVKQHLDLSLTSVTRELREMKQLLREQHETPAAVPSGTKPAQISDSAFRAAGNRMSTYVATPHLDQAAAAPRDENPAGVHLANELKAQYEALQKLRSDFAILRQVHGDAEQDLRNVFADVRAQVKEMEQITALGPSAGRNLIECGKGKLDARSQEVLTTVEDLQDLIEDLKLDVSHRGVKPKAHEIRRITGEIDTATKRLDELEQFVQNVKPGWKKTWEAELQNIVDEQEFLNYQEGLLADLKQDHRALQDVFANIQQVVRLRDIGRDAPDQGARGQRYVPPPPDEEHEGIGTVMIEVRGQSIDHDRRVRALQAAERSRERARAGHKDEFASELAGFVDGNALRKTGGHREVDRIRQKRDQTTLRSMLSGPEKESAPPSAM